MTKKTLLALFIVALFIPVLAGCGSLPKSAVAEVDGKVITREDLDQNVKDLEVQYGGQGGLPQPGTPEYEELQKQVAQRLVNEEILWFEAEKLGITVTDEEVNEQIDTFIEQAGGEEQFQQQLDERGYTEDRLKEQIRKSLIFQKLYPEVTKEAAEVTDDQALQYYTQNQAMFQQGETRTVRHILVADEATANQAKARLDAGEDFATVAKEMSTDPGSKDKGGELGAYPTTNSGLVPEFEQAMAGLAVNQISAPVKSQFGYHIIQVTKITPAGVQPFEDAKEELKAGLALENQRTAFEAWFESIKCNYTVVWSEEFRPAEWCGETFGTETISTAPAGTQTGTVTGTQTQAAPVQ